MLKDLELQKLSVVWDLGQVRNKKQDNHFQNIWVKLEFSCEIERYGNSIIPAFQEIFTSTHKIFILDGELSAR